MDFGYYHSPSCAVKIYDARYRRYSVGDAVVLGADSKIQVINSLTKLPVSGAPTTDKKLFGFVRVGNRHLWGWAARTCSDRDKRVAFRV